MIAEMRFHHVGVGVINLDSAKVVYQALGYTVLRDVADPVLDVRICFLRSRTQGQPLIELLAPLGDEGPLSALIRRRMLPSPYHTCYSVVDIPETGARLRDLGFMPVGPEKPAVAFGGASVQFYYSPDVGLIELVESQLFLEPESVLA
jgi:methylmalonyl-CoA/ethylmalonyl-CoA epimerase